MNIHDMYSREEGMVLVLILMIVALLTLAGIAAINTSVTEVQTASNHMQQKVAFYAAEGGLEVASELLEQNIACATGFTEDEEELGEATIGTIRVTVLDLLANESADEPSDGSRDIYFPYDYGDGPHTNITVGARPVLSEGFSLQITDAYNGTGKSIARGGANILCDIHTQHKGRSKSESEVKIQWRHVVGQEDPDCRY